jgi:hypothetical protein
MLAAGARTTLGPIMLYVGIVSVGYFVTISHVEQLFYEQQFIFLLISYCSNLS